jgi:hypothetical protein
LKMVLLLIGIVCVLIIATGCSYNNKSVSDERWNYKEGFVVAKENDRILVVRDRADIKSPLSEILNCVVRQLLSSDKNMYR